MKKFLFAAALAVSLSALVPAQAADVGVSVQISQPGVYGRIDIGRFPQPQVVLAQPVIVQRPAYVAQPLQPLYLWVPPAHRQNWRRHCSRYNACGSLVYFVRDDWYGRNVRGHGHDGDHHDDRSHGRDERRDDRGQGRDERRDDHRDGGKGRGNGRGDERGQGRGH